MLILMSIYISQNQCELPLFTFVCLLNAWYPVGHPKSNLSIVASSAKDLTLLYVSCLTSNSTVPQVAMWSGLVLNWHASLAKVCCMKHMFNSKAMHSAAHSTWRILYSSFATFACLSAFSTDHRFNCQVCQTLFPFRCNCFYPLKNISKGPLLKLKMWSSSDICLQALASPSLEWCICLFTMVWSINDFQ